jgi:flagellar hook-length control protein FliK
MELLAATRPKNGVTILLQPEDLGNVVMTVKNLGGSVEAHISASDDRVRTALEQNGSLLVQAMDHRGIKLESVTVSAQSQQQQQQSGSAQRDANAQQQGQQHQAHQSRNQSGGSYSSGAHTTHRGTTHEARQAVRSFSGVDYWI